jgi:hypothetical protein
VAFAAPYPGKILPMDLRQLGGTLICQKTPSCARRAACRWASPPAEAGTGFGGEGFIMQKLDGDGLAFVHAGGTVVARAAGRPDPAGGHRLRGGLHAQRGLRDPVRRQDQDGAVRRRGPVPGQADRAGQVWLQSLPFSRLASRIFAAAPQRGGSKEEGSVLGGLAGGSLLGGMLGGGDED